jgi:uncharacterized protein YdhG (YjbR/CyaY superfamily)
MDKDLAPDIDAYLAALPEAQRAALVALRDRIRTAVPEGTAESISYGVPTWKYRGKPLIYFAAAKKHLAIYAVPGGTVRFQPDSLPSDETLRGWIAERVAAIEGKS